MAGTTLGMAVGMVPLSATALSRGLFTRMLAFLVLAALAGLLVAAMPSIGTLVAARVLQGVLISLVPASALALIGFRIERSAVTSATGVYLAGNTVGGLFSRVGPGLIAELADWRSVIGVMSMLCLLCSAGVALLHPPGGEAVALPPWSPVPAVRAGLALMTALFFVGHVIASASVSRAAPPGTGATTSAVYLTFYYAGATAGSALGSLGFQHAGWAATASLATVWTLAAGAAALLLRRHLPAP